MTVPNVTGQTQAQATSALEAAGLTAAPTTTTSCTTADNGNVVTQNPAGGTSVAQGHQRHHRCMQRGTRR